jgi:hypothetical protein
MTILGGPSASFARISQTVSIESLHTQGRSSTLDASILLLARRHAGRLHRQSIPSHDRLHSMSCTCQQGI